MFELTTIRLARDLAGLGVTLARGEELPCFPSSQVAILKGREDAIYHLMSGLYAAFILGKPGKSDLPKIRQKLAAAGFPLRGGGEGPPAAQALLCAGDIIIALAQGNIADCATEVIVNAANEGLWMGGGVAGALRGRGGIELEKEARMHAPAPQGEIVLTGAGRLRAKEIYHAVVIDQHHMTRTELGSVEAAFQKVLETAIERGVSSVAVPFLGCGVGGLEIPDVARAYASVARSVAAVKKRCLLVVLVALEEGETAKAAEALGEAEDPEAEKKLAEEYLKEAVRALEQGPSVRKKPAGGPQ